MSRPLRLVIHKDGIDQTFENDRIDAGSVVVDERTRGLDVEVGEVDVRVHDAISDGSVTSHFLDLDPAAVTDAVYRARLDDATTRETIFDGSIDTADVEYEERTATWTVVLRQNAQSEFRALDTDIRTVDKSGVPSVQIDLYVIDDLKEDPFPALEREISNISQGSGGGPEVVYEPVPLLKAILDDLGVTYSMPSQLWPNATEEDGDISRVDTLYATTGNFSARDWIEAILSMAGWRAKASYQVWPSLDLHVTFEPVDGSTGSYTPGTAYDWQRRSYEQKPAQVIELANPLHSVKPTSLTLKKSTEVYMFDAQPPAFGRSAAEVWDARPPSEEPYATLSRTVAFRDKDPRELRGDVQTLDVEYMPVSLAEFGDVITRTVGGVNEEVAIGPGLIEASTVDTVRLALVYDDGGSTEFPVIHSISRPVPGRAYCGGWPVMPFQQRQQERGFQRIREQETGGRVTLEDVGTYRPHRVEYDVDRDTTVVEAREVVAERYAEEPALTASWTVMSVDGRLHATDYRTGSTEYYIQAWWQRSEHQFARELYYNAQVRVDDPNYGGSNAGEWIDVTPRGGSAAFPNRIYATSFSGLSVFFDGSYYTPTPGNGNIKARVRPVTPGGTAGDWTETQIFRDDA